MAFIPLLQFGMYVESTSVIKSHRASNGIAVQPHFTLEGAIENGGGLVRRTSCESKDRLVKFVSYVNF